MKKIISKIFKKVGYLLLGISKWVQAENKIEELENHTYDIESIRSILIEKGQGRDLYKTRFGDLLWLDSNSCIDESIIKTGVWEDYSTNIVNRLVKPNDYVLDIGANIGYYTVLFSKLVGNNGKVFAVEPTKNYYNVLISNLKENNISNCEPFQIGFSDKEEKLKVFLGQHSASIYDVGVQEFRSYDWINLLTLNTFIINNKIEKIDFIKIDVDGHEPKILEGAWDTLEKFNPIILLEISHLHYLEAGYTAWDFYQILKDKKYFIYSEKTLSEIKDKTSFLIECGNFAYSSNIIISKYKLYL